MQITKGKIDKAKKVVIYGAEGIGKSTLASKFPEAVFIDTEGSTNTMDVARLPKPESWSYLLEELEYIKSNQGVCKTLVIDTIDWAEAMCVEAICAKHQKKGIEDFGYGNGYVYVREEIGRFLNKLSEIVDVGINVVLTAHAQMRKFEQPDEMGAYDRWELKLGKKTSSQTSPLVKEWADMVLFCNYKTSVVNVDGQGTQKGKNKAQGGKRVMYTSHHVCWDAKNRFDLPEEIDMDFEAIRHIFTTTTSVKEQMQPKAEEVPKEEPTVRKQQNAETTIIRDEPIEEPPQTIKEAAKEEVPESTANEEVKDNKIINRFLSKKENIPKALIDLMEKDDFNEWNIQDACFEKGYFPKDTLIQDMPEDFVQGVLIGAWEQVKKVMQKQIEEAGVIFK